MFLVFRKLIYFLKIFSLSDTIEQLETKCEEMQKSVEEAKQLRLQEEQKGRMMTKSASEIDNVFVRRSLSGEYPSEVNQVL